MNVPFIIDADLEPLLEKMNTCHKNPKHLSTTKVNKHTPSSIHCLLLTLLTLFTHCSFDTTKNRLD